MHLAVCCPAVVGLVQVKEARVLVMPVKVQGDVPKNAWILFGTFATVEAQVTVKEVPGQMAVGALMSVIPIAQSWSPSGGVAAVLGPA